MKPFCIAGIALAGVVLCIATAVAAPAECSVPADRLLHRLELDLPGATRVTRSVAIPADTEVLIEAFETKIDSRLEVRSAGAEVVTIDSPLPRWSPHRLIVPKGPARNVDVSVVGE